MHTHKHHRVRNTLMVLIAFVGGIVTTVLATGALSDTSKQAEEYASSMFSTYSSSIKDKDIRKQVELYTSGSVEIEFYIQALDLFQKKLEYIVNNNTNIQDINQAITLTGMTFSTSATIKNTIDPLKTLIIEVVKTGSTLPIQSTTDPVVNTTDQAVATTQGGTGPSGTTSTPGQKRTVTTPESCIEMNTYNCDRVKSNSAYKYIKISNGNKQYFITIDCYAGGYDYMNKDSDTNWKGSYPSIEQPKNYACIPEISSTVTDPAVETCNAGSVNFYTNRGTQMSRCIGSVGTGTAGEMRTIPATQGVGTAKVTCTGTGWTVATDTSTSCTTGTTGSGGGSSSLGYQVNNTNNTVAGSCSAGPVEFFSMVPGSTVRKNCVVSAPAGTGGDKKTITATQGEGSANLVCSADNKWVPTTGSVCTTDKNATTGGTPSPASATLSVMSLGYGGANSPWGYEGYEPIIEGKDVDVIYNVENVKTCSASYTELNQSQLNTVLFRDNQGGNSTIIGPHGSTHGTFTVPGIKMHLVFTCTPLVGSTPVIASIDFKQTKPDPGDTITINLKTKNGVALPNGTDSLTLKERDTIVFDYAFGDNFIQCTTNQQVAHQKGIGNYLFGADPSSGYPDRSGTAIWTVGKLASTSGSLDIICIRNIDRKSRIKGINWAFVASQDSASASQVIPYMTIGGDTVANCSRRILNQFGTQKYSCSIGGGCTMGGQKPANPIDSANPSIPGACFPVSEWNSATVPTVKNWDLTSMKEYINTIRSDANAVNTLIEAIKTYESPHLEGTQMVRYIGLRELAAEVLAPVTMEQMNSYFKTSSPTE